MRNPVTNNILAVSGAAELLIYHMPCLLRNEFVSLVARRKAAVLRAACAWSLSWALILLLMEEVLLQQQPDREEQGDFLRQQKQDKETSLVE